MNAYVPFDLDPKERARVTREAGVDLAEMVIRLFEEWENDVPIDAPKGIALMEEFDSWTPERWQAYYAEFPQQARRAMRQYAALLRKYRPHYVRALEQAL